MKVRMVHQPTGYISLGGGPLREWPRAGETMDLPDGMAQTMIGAGNVAAVEDEVETRPAPTAGVETRQAEPTTDSAPDAKAVRAWAAENGIDVPKRGKVSDDVIEQYTKAHEGD